MLGSTTRSVRAWQNPLLLEAGKLPLVAKTLKFNEGPGRTLPLKYEPRWKKGR
ncbi:hypothetical protein QFZ69_004704 [Arthrobacter sp. V1I7]|nr:hypothetical protein [Arthrobacter sp. V1I7]